jgi:hypothetical protein
VISWAKQHLSDLLVPEGWGTGEVALVVSYLIKYQAQVAKCLGQMRMVEEAGLMLKVSMGQSLKSVEVERKGLTLRMVDKMEQVVGLVKDLVEEAVQASRETVRSGKELGVKVESVLEGIMEERGVLRMEREKEREREREGKRERKGGREGLVPNWTTEQRKTKGEGYKGEFNYNNNSD